MKKISLATIVTFVAMICLPGCSQVQPEEKAAIIGYPDYTMCGGCGGRFVHVDSTWYRADIEAPFDKGSKPVWIRFKKDESDGLKSNGRWIIISSIRNRE